MLIPKRILSIPSNTLILGAYAESLSDNSGNPYKVKEIVITQQGSYRVRYALAADTAGSTASARLYKNGAALGGTYTNAAASYIDLQEDVGEFKPGDLLQVYAWAPAGFKAKVRNLTLSGDLALRPLGITPGTINKDS